MTEEIFDPSIDDLPYPWDFSGHPNIIPEGYVGQKCKHSPTVTTLVTKSKIDDVVHCSSKQLDGECRVKIDHNMRISDAVTGDEHGVLRSRNADVPFKSTKCPFDEVVTARGITANIIHYMSKYNGVRAIEPVRG